MKSQLIPRKLLFGNPVKTSPELSPNGEKMAYLAPDNNNVLNVWVRDLTKKASEDKMVTSDKKRGVRNFLWQYDNNHILYVQDRDGDENWHLYQTDINTNETKNLTPYDGSRIEIVDYNYKYPDDILVQINKRDKSLFDVYRINLKNGDSQLVVENTNNTINWIADHQLVIRARQSYTKDGGMLTQVRDDENAPWRDLLETDPEEIGGEVIDFTDDDQSLYLLSSLNGNTNRLLKISLKGGTPEVVLEDKEFDLSSIMTHPTKNTLEAAGVEKDRWDWIIVDPSLKKDFENLKKIEKGIFTINSRTLSNRKWIVAFRSDQRPSQFYLYNRDTGKADFLFTSQPDLEKYTLNPMTPISFQAEDGMTIHGYLTLPAGDHKKNLSTILLVHGGPWVRDTWGLNPAVQWLANRGYAVLQINYRGSKGYGKAYMNAGNREWAGKMHTDLLDGKKWMIKNGYSNPDKFAIYGGSYGGYATLVGLTFTPDEFCCGVDIVGPSNLITLLQTLPPYWAPAKVQMDRRVGKLETEQDFLKSRSPLFKANLIKKPLLIGQGANDPRVKQAESDQIVQVMRQNKLPVEYLLFPDEGHGFARPENRMKFYAATEEFLEKYLGGISERPSKEEDWESLKK
ncbi:MAG: S9 family peptidase [Parachlamydiaceae bacterium]|nr:S9 family peptidase [Parachlamydiaceae bacterium]